MTTNPTGHDAIDYAEQNGITRLWKHTDPTDEARWVTIDEARDIVREDPGLVVALGAGDRVEGGLPNTEDHDTGTVCEIGGDQITVAWDSGVRTTQHVDVVWPE